MPRNVEIKARLDAPSVARVRKEARTRATQPPAVETQVDTYFEVDPGGESRVKLRESDRHGVHLIRYHRPEDAGVRPSEYSLEPMDGPGDPRLAPLGDPVLVVTKRREVIWVENVRVHLDEVEALGTFLELEAVVGPEHPEARCHEQVDELLEAFGVSRASLIQASYSDLLAEAKGLA